MRSITLVSLLVFFTPIFARKFHPKVPWGRDVQFVLDTEVSDDFEGPELNLEKWDPHGVRNPETGCPKWNGPPSTDFPEYATYFPTTTNPETGRPTEKQYEMVRGKLFLKMDEKPLEYFKAREYYCNATTFKCNHDETINCFATDIFGNPKFADDEKTVYKAIVHDKCKKEPFCIPHPEYVTGERRVYTKYVGAHLTGKKSFKYGYTEVLVRLGRSPAVAAAWMHDDHFVNGYCRLKRNPHPNRTFPIRECPSVIRSRRWQEIDVLESMNSQIHKRRYIPNIHAFSGYKGEFTSKTAVDNGDGNAGGGPIILEPGVFDLKRPNFSDVPAFLRRPNDYHYNPGSVYELEEEWAARQRAVGMYWSPNEIRFLLDGKEVRRVKNNLIHQPMYLDLSYALNVAWAQEFPTLRHLKFPVRFHHFRRWQVFTRDGNDPPSDLPLDTHQDRRFQDLYGSELGGVFGRFPANDNETVTLTHPSMADMMEERTTEPSAESDTGTMGASPESRASVRSWVWIDDSAGPKPTTRTDDSEGVVAEDEAVVRLLGEGYRPAGGDGNVRYPSAVPKMTKRERRVAEAREDRMAVVEDGTAEMVTDGAVTAYEFTDPNGDQAGWGMAFGMGMGMDDPRMDADKKMQDL